MHSLYLCSKEKIRKTASDKGTNLENLHKNLEYWLQDQARKNKWRRAIAHRVYFASAHHFIVFKVKNNQKFSRANATAITCGFERIRESFSQILKAGVHRLCSRNPDYISDQKKRFFSTEFQSKTCYFWPSCNRYLKSIERGTFCREHSSALDSQKELCCLWENTTDFVHWKWHEVTVIVTVFHFYNQILGALTNYVFKCLVLFPLLYLLLNRNLEPRFATDRRKGDPTFQRKTEWDLGPRLVKHSCSVWEW